MEEGRPRLEPSHAFPSTNCRPASSKGICADVGGRLEGAYRHCAHDMLPFRHDFDDM